LVAFAMRAYLLLTSPPALFPSTDNTWYDAVARSIEDGHLGRLPAVGGGRVLSIRFPPGYPIVLSVGRLLLFWVNSFDAHLWTGAALGALATGAVAALAWRLGRRAPVRVRALATIAAGLLFALNPAVVGASVSLMSEALVLTIVAFVLLVIDRLVTGDGHRWEAVVLGALLAIGALTRSEAIVVLAGAVVGGYAVSRARPRARVPWVVALAIGLGVAIAWSSVASVVAERPVVMGTNSGSLLLGANCPVTHTADGIGYWSIECLTTPDRDLSAETARRSRAQAEFLEHHFALPPQIGGPGEAELSSLQADAAIDEIFDTPLDTAAAVPVRVLRGLGLYWSPLQDEQEVFEGRNHSWEVAGRWFNIVLILPFALLTLAAAVFRRSRIGATLREVVEARRLVPSLALAAVWVLTIAVSYGSARFRAAIEPSLAVFAGLGITIVVTALTQRGRTDPAS
jgi:prepilin signal peptidase PulO-like enzyme (type II secretory pathway)